MPTSSTATSRRKFHADHTAPTQSPNSSSKLPKSLSAAGAGADGIVDIAGIGAEAGESLCCRLAEDVGTGSGTGEMGALAERVDGVLREADGGGWRKEVPRAEELEDMRKKRRCVSDDRIGTLNTIGRWSVMMET
eukprot:740727-Rhodomonas_salina.1